MSESALAAGPQYGEGPHGRSFLVAKAPGGSYRIYDYGTLQPVN